MGDRMLTRLKASVSRGLAARRAGRAGEEGRTADHGGSGGVRVAYEPAMDGDADPGEVVWAWVPYEEDPLQGKDRPVLVLGHDGPLLAGVPLSSRDRTGGADGHEWVAVGTGPWDSRRRPSFADASRLLRMRPTDVRREGAALDRSAFDRVLDRVAALHDWSDHR